MEKLTILVCVHSINEFYDMLLKKALISLSNQTYKTFKTLIILDECWVNTKPMIESSNFDLNLKIIENPKKQGLYYVKNLGLSLIDTEWVGFLDGDDLYLPTKIETQINYLENNYVDFLGTHRYHIDKMDDEKINDGLFDVNSYITHSEIEVKLLSENILTHGSMIIRKKCLDELGGYQNIRGTEDWDLWDRAFKQGYKFHQIPERLYKYREYSSVTR
jgi:glycosyltransferase EpsE